MSYENLEVIKECDVLVVGGGPSGCAAAIQSAREGAKTLLIEQSGMLGGATVNQDVVVVLSQNAVDFEGIWHEYMSEIFALDGARREEFGFLPLSIRGTVDPNVVRVVWDRLIQKSGADLILHCHFVDVIKEGSKIVGVVVNTRQGLGLIKVKTVIDCTGDAIVCNNAGAKWESGGLDSKYAMSLTKVMRLGGVESDEGVTKAEKEKLKQILEQECANGRYKSPLLTTGRILYYINDKMIWYLKKRKELMLVTSRILNCDPTSYEDITRAEREGLQSLFEVYDFYKRFVPHCENCFISHISNQVGVRSSRRVIGRYYVTQDDAINCKKFDDGIAKVSFGIDVWPSNSYTAPAGNAGGISDKNILKDFEKRIENGDYFEIPYGALVAEGFDNLMMAGRIVSASHMAQAALRIQQTCMSTGQAAGYAAAMGVKKNLPPCKLDGKEIASGLSEIRKNTPLSWDKFTVDYYVNNVPKINKS
jgi:hypothetical protein